MAKSILVGFSFFFGFLIPNILLFLPRREVDDSSVEITSYMLDSVFRRPHRVFKLKVLVTDFFKILKLNFRMNECFM